MYSILLKTNTHKTYYRDNFIIVPDLGSRDRDVVLVRRMACWGTQRGVGNLEWGGTGVDLGRGRSVYEQPGQGGQDRITPKEGFQVSKGE